MANLEDILKEQTFKGDVDEIGRRVYYTITNTKGSPAPKKFQDRVARGFSQLIEVLRQRNAITDGDVDNILLKMVGY